MRYSPCSRQEVLSCSKHGWTIENTNRPPATRESAQAFMADVQSGMSRKTMFAMTASNGPPISGN
jgi:hypothetical protein